VAFSGHCRIEIPAPPTLFCYPISIENPFKQGFAMDRPSTLKIFPPQIQGKILLDYCFVKKSLKDDHMVKHVIVCQQGDEWYCFLVEYISGIPCKVEELFSWHSFLPRAQFGEMLMEQLASLSPRFVAGGYRALYWEHTDSLLMCVRMPVRHKRDFKTYFVVFPTPEAPVAMPLPKRQHSPLSKEDWLKANYPGMKELPKWRFPASL
jgi:hypothetical protein